METKPTLVIVYVPTPLRSMTEICKTLGVGPKTVKLWVEAGAPIAVEGTGRRARYSAELARLQLWRSGDVGSHLHSASSGG